MNLAQFPDGLEGKLVHVIEECAEVQQEACKVLRFGLHGFHPRDEKRFSNWARLHTELAQLLVAIDRLESEMIDQGCPHIPRVTT